MYILNTCCSALSAGEGGGGGCYAMSAKHTTQKHGSIVNDNDNDNECLILTYKLMKLIICNTMINQYSHSQGNYIMTYTYRWHLTTDIFLE